MNNTIESNVLLNEVADFLYSCDNVYVFTHINPDGDTLGGAFGLVNVLRQLGKKANVLCADELPKRYDYLYESYSHQEFEPKNFITVDIADSALLGNALDEYKDKINLCIDHHISNTHYAKLTFLDATAAAVCEVIYKLFLTMNVDMDAQTASCLYTGIVTDTGCFKYSNTTANTHVAASELIKLGTPYAIINRKMMDLKSKSRLHLEQTISSEMEFYFNDKCTLTTITREFVEKMGIPPDEFEGLAGLTLQLEETEVGVVIKEKADGKYKISMRASGNVNVSEICKEFSGGGHIKAAGCTLDGNLQEVKTKILNAIKLRLP